MPNNSAKFIPPQRINRNAGPALQRSDRQRGCAKAKCTPQALLPPIPGSICPDKDEAVALLFFGVEIGGGEMAYFAIRENFLQLNQWVVYFSKI